MEKEVDELEPPPLERSPPLSSCLLPSRTAAPPYAAVLNGRSNTRGAAKTISSLSPPLWIRPASARSAPACSLPGPLMRIEDPPTPPGTGAPHLGIVRRIPFADCISLLVPLHFAEVLRTSTFLLREKGRLCKFLKR